MSFKHSRKRSGHFGGLVFFLAACCVQFLSGQQGRISGKVTDASSGEPLIGANVVANSSLLSNPTGSATDADGIYAIRQLRAGSYTLSISYIGYEASERTVQLRPGETIQVDFDLIPAAIQFETYVVTASRKRERVEDAPAAITVITEIAIRRESNTNLGDYLKAVKGVDFTQSGVDSYNLSARGFNSSFSSRLLTLTDGRMANVPSLRLIAYNTIPVSFDDVKQFEIVLGPSSALYGPNAHSGVLNIITKSPLRSPGTQLNLQAGTNDIRKLSFRHSSAYGPLGFKVSVVSLTAHEWEHVNSVEYEAHDPNFLGRPSYLRDRIANDGKVFEIGNPQFTEEMLAAITVGEVPNDGIDNNGNGFIDESTDMVGWIYADGMDNLFQDGESGAPVVTQAMIDAAASDPFGRYNVPGTDIVLWGVDAADLGRKYADGVDNDGDGLIDENIDNGIDDLSEVWYDGVDNDGDGEFDEDDERGSRWLTRFGGYAPNQFGDYIYDAEGNISFDSNGDGEYGGVGDSTISYGNLPSIISDANGDGISDFPSFDVKNLRYDIRADYEPNPNTFYSFSHGYAWARNINITGLARYLADGWIYRYYQGRFRYKNIFAQAYLNTSLSGSDTHPTRSLSSGIPIVDKSKKFSAQIQHVYETKSDRFRVVWGADYFLTLPDTRGSILADNQLFDGRDSNGNGEGGSPITFQDLNDNGSHDPGEGYSLWTSDSADNVLGAIADGIDNDGDGLIDEGIDDKTEDNRYTVNEIGIYYQANLELSEKFELIQATRFDAHDRLTNFIEFNNGDRNFSPAKWDFNFGQRDGLQISPKIGLMFKPREHQNLRLTWARAFNTPSNQALFLDLFVTRASIFKVFARGAGGGYRFPRAANGAIYYQSAKDTRYHPVDTENHIAFYLSADPRIKGYFKSSTISDLEEIRAEDVNTLEFGYKGRLHRSLYGTIDLYRSHYSDFVSPITFITPIIVNKTLLTRDWDGDGNINTDPENIIDQEDLEAARDNWTGSDYLAGIGALDTSGASGNVPIVVGYANYGAVDMTGLDLSLSWFVNRSVSVDLNYSYIGLSQFLNPITGAQDPINGPKHKGSVKVQYNPPSQKVSSSLSVRFVDDFLWASGIFFGEIKAYQIVDFHSSYMFNDHLSLMFSLSNVLNNKHVEIIGGPALGRLAVVRLNTSL